MEEAQVLSMINDRLAKLEHLPALVAGMQADLRNLQGTLERQNLEAGSRLSKLEDRVSLLEKQVGAIDVKKPVANRLQDLEKNLGLLAKASWAIAAGVLAQLGKPLLEMIARALQ